MSEISRVNNTIANNLTNKVNYLTISASLKKSLIMDINKELIKANSVDESIDNSFIYYTEKFISECKQIRIIKSGAKR